MHACLGESVLELNRVVKRVFVTQSLGMGTDYPNIREVIHWGVPHFLEDYHQERAERDGLPARATLLYAAHQLHETFCNKSVIDYCNSQGCYHKVILDYFCDLLVCAVVTVHIHEKPMHDAWYIIKYIKHNSYNELVT